MMCYKDRAWCKHSLGDPKTKCVNYECDRNLNPEEREQAVKWWRGTNFPISVCDFKTEECGYIGADQTGGQNELR